MANDLFEQALQRLLRVEGDFSDHPADSGGATRFGITEAVARRHGYRGHMQDLPVELAKKIYRKDYWDVLRLDEVAAASASSLMDPSANVLAYKLFDAAVNVGTLRAGEWLQRCLNVMNQRGAWWPDLVVDGLVGPRTLSALRAYVQRRGSEGLVVLVRALNCLQGAFYIGLAERRQKDELFVYGWLRERVQ